MYSFHLCVVLLLTWVGFSSVVSGGNLTFTVIGDWGRVGDKNQIKVAKAMEKWAKQEQAQFVVSVGDNFYDVGVSSVDDPQFKTAWQDVYMQPGTYVGGLDWYMCAGNKEYDGNITAVLKYHAIDSRWNMPAEYFSFDKTMDDNKKVKFIIVSSKTIDEDPQQREWLEATLRDSADSSSADYADWVIVVSHHPVYSVGKNGIRTRTLWIQEYALPLLRDYKVALVLNGHDHSMQHTFKPGEPTDYITSGAGHDADEELPKALDMLENDFGARLGYFRSKQGFVGITMSGDDATISYISTKGNVKYQFTKRNPRASSSVDQTQVQGSCNN